MPLVFEVAIKPTPSIAMTQKSISLSTMKNTDLTINGRHDPCIVPRAVPVIEAAAAIAIFDAILINNQYSEVNHGN
jgi:chorismate synthase